MIFSLPCFSLVSPTKRLTLNLFMKWDYKQWEIHQTSPIPFCCKRLKLALGKAVSASCSSNLATTSAGEPSSKGERGCVSCQAAWCVCLFCLSFLSLFCTCMVHRKGGKRECSCCSGGADTSETPFSSGVTLHSSRNKSEFSLNVRMISKHNHGCSHIVGP